MKKQKTSKSLRNLQI